MNFSRITVTSACLWLSVMLPIKYVGLIVFDHWSIRTRKYWNRNSYSKGTWMQLLTVHQDPHFLAWIDGKATRPTHCDTMQTRLHRMENPQQARPHATVISGYEILLKWSDLQGHEWSLCNIVFHGEVSFLCSGEYDGGWIENHYPNSSPAISNHFSMALTVLNGFWTPPMIHNIGRLPGVFG